MDGDYYRPTYKVPTYRPPTTYKKTYTPRYREEPYDNSGAMRAAEQARLLREAAARQAAQEAIRRQQEAVRQAQLQKQAAIDRAAQAQQSRTSLNSFWNKVNTTIVPDIGSAFQVAGNAFVNPNYKVPANTWQTYTRPTSGGGFNDGGYREEPSDAFGSINPTYGFPGYAEDWGMAQSGRYGSGMLDIGNWGRGVPTWEEVLKFADPNSFNPYDIAGHPLDHVVDTVIPETYYPDYGYDGYGGGSYSSKPGYYGSGNSNYGKNYYENLLQWNI
jgi:hypothetical protein